MKFVFIIKYGLDVWNINNASRLDFELCTTEQCGGLCYSSYTGTAL